MSITRASTTATPADSSWRRTSARSSGRGGSGTASNPPRCEQTFSVRYRVVHLPARETTEALVASGPRESRTAGLLGKRFGPEDVRSGAFDQGAIGAPHFAQNFAPATFGDPQDEQNFCAPEVAAGGAVTVTGGAPQAGAPCIIG